jgi:UrcA family protein
MRSGHATEHIMNKLLTTLAAGLALSGSAAASTRDDVPNVVVRYGDLNLDSREGVARLHARLSSAARTVCSAFDSRILGVRKQYDSCISGALTQSIDAIGNENLRNFHRQGVRRFVLAAN